MATGQTFSGERIEELQQIAGEHLFMHAMQTKDWRESGLQIFVKGEGCWVTDIEGNRLFDMTSSLWYKSAGYGHKEIADAVYRQMLEITSPPAWSTAIPTIELSGKIAEHYHDKDARTFFVSGGSEAVETAVKMAKKYQILSGKPRAYKVISRRNSYHGSTAMAVSLGRSAAADPAGPEMVGAVHVANYDAYRPPLGGETREEIALRCADDFETAIVHQGPETVAAMIAEPVSQMSGIHVPPRVYWQRLREIADKYDVVLIADEVITGFGRLGEWFGMTCFDVAPDITTVAKAITSGYAPLGAVIASKNVADAFMGGEAETFRHIITFGGHPVSAAAALANIAIFERDDLVGNAKRMGEHLAEELQPLYEHPIVGDIRGIGLLQTVELVRDSETKESFPSEAGLADRLPDLLAERGMLSFRVGNIVSMCPPLCVSEDEIDFMVKSVDGAIGAMENELGVR